MLTTACFVGAGWGAMLAYAAWEFRHAAADERPEVPDPVLAALDAGRAADDARNLGCVGRGGRWDEGEPGTDGPRLAVRGGAR